FAMEPGEQVNILLVDDQPSKLLSYEVILSELGENLIKANSANEALELLLRGYEAGGVDYITVPVIPELLRAKVRVFADLYRKNRQLERMNTELERRV